MGRGKIDNNNTQQLVNEINTIRAKRRALWKQLGLSDQIEIYNFTDINSVDDEINYIGSFFGFESKLIPITEEQKLFKQYYDLLRQELNKLKQLKNKNIENKNIENKEIENKEIENKNNKIGNNNSFLLKAVKSIAAIFDELPLVLTSALKSSGKILEVIGNYLLNAVPIILHFFNLKESYSKFKKAFQDKTTPQRKTKLLTQGAILFFSVSGIGLGAISVAALAGAAMLSTPFTVAACFGLLTASAAMKFAKTAYVLYKARQQEISCKEKYNLCDKGDGVFSTTKSEKFQEYESAKNKRLAAERKFAYAAIELTLSIMLTAGVVLGIAAIVGGSVASMGALPLAMGITVAVGGIAVSIFQEVDKRYDHKITNGIRNFFSTLFSPRVVPQPEVKKVDLETEKKLSEMSSAKIMQEVGLPVPDHNKSSVSKNQAQQSPKKIKGNIEPKLEFDREEGEKYLPLGSSLLRGNSP